MLIIDECDIIKYMVERISEKIYKSLETAERCARPFVEMRMASLALRDSNVDVPDFQELTQTANRVIDADNDDSTAVRFRMARTMRDDSLVAKLLAEADHSPGH